MTKKYTRKDIHEIVEYVVYNPFGDFPPEEVSRRVVDALFAEGIFDPNQVEGA